MQNDIDRAPSNLSVFSEFDRLVSVHEGLPQKRQERQTSLRDFLSIIFKYKRTISSIFVVIFATVTAATFLIPPTYEAQSTILVKFGREYTYRPEVTDKTPVISVNQEEALNSEIKIITSAYLIEKVVRALQVKTIYPDLSAPASSTVPPLDAATRRFKKHLKVEVEKKTNVLEVSFRHRDPKVAAKAVNLLVDFYKERHFQVYNGPESEFLQKQVAAFEEKLKDSQNNLQNFKQKHMVYSLEEQRALLLKQRADLDASLKNTISHINGIEEKAGALGSQLKELSRRDERHTQTERDRIIVEAKAQLLALQMRERDLLTKYPESNRLVVNVRDNIASTNDFLQRQERETSTKVRTSNPVYLQTESQTIQNKAELKAAQAEARTLRQQLASIDGAIEELDRNESQLQNLAREVSTNDKNYRNYLDRFEEARISDDMTRHKLANLSIIEPASIPVLPIRPNKVLNIVIGFILGAASALGYVILAECTSQRLSNAADAQRRLGIPVLATVGLKHMEARTCS